MSKIKDKVHDSIKLDEIAAEICKTPWFQRLKEINQLGFVNKISVKFGYGEIIGHSRYYHSIGTYYLAGVFLDNLETNSKGKIDEIDDFYKLCVKIAGLLHDIAHGPFSHFWEDSFNKNYKHEDSSEIIIDDIFSKIDLHEDQQKHEDGVALIKSLIKGEKNPKKKFPHLPEYLFEIINNKFNGIDVDKWDYIKRDYYHCNKFLLRKDIVNIEAKLQNIDKLFTGAKISDNSEHIDFGSSENKNNLFEVRFMFHKNIYRLPEVSLLDKAVAKILEFANTEPNYGGFRKDLKSITPANENDFLELYDDNINKIIDDLYRSINKRYIPQKIKKYLNYYKKLNFEKVSNEMKQPTDDYIQIKIEKVYYDYYFRET